METATTAAYTGCLKRKQEVMPRTWYAGKMVVSNPTIMLDTLCMAMPLPPRGTVYPCVHGLTFAEQLMCTGSAHAIVLLLVQPLKTYSTGHAIWPNLKSSRHVA